MTDLILFFGVVACESGRFGPLLFPVSSVISVFHAQAQDALFHLLCTSYVNPLPFINVFYIRVFLQVHVLLASVHLLPALSWQVFFLLVESNRV